MSKTDKIIKTVQALRARAADAASSETEAMAALERADKMMRKNALTLDDLQEVRRTTGVITGTWGGSWKKLHPVEFTLIAIARLTEVRSWIRTDHLKAKSIVVLGLPSDVEYALYLIDLIHNAMEAEWARFRNGATYTNAPRNSRTRMREDFMRGMAVRIRERIIEMAATNATHAPEITHQKGGTAVVIAKRDMIAEAMMEMKVNPRKARARVRTVDAVPYFAGKAAGDRTVITTGIGN